MNSFIGRHDGIAVEINLINDSCNYTYQPLET